MWKRILTTAALAGVLAFAMAGCGSSSTSTSGAAESASGSSNEAVEAPQAQVFEADVATATYRDKMEPSPGNAMYTFAFENKTDKTVIVSGENVLVNDAFSVQTLGGSAVPIAPGTTGSVSLVFGYTVQTSLESMDDITSIACDLVMRDNDALATEVGRVRVSVEV